MSLIRPVIAKVDAPVINILLTLRTAPDFCKNVSLAELLGTTIILI